MADGVFYAELNEVFESHFLIEIKFAFCFCSFSKRSLHLMGILVSK